jgi:hypothetical protein
LGRNKIGYTAPEGLIRKPGSSCWYIKVGIGKYKSTGTSDINIAKAILSRMKGERHLSLVRGNDTPGEISDGIVCKIINESKESFPVKPLPPFKKGFYEKLRVPKEERRHTGNHHRTIESLSRKLEGDYRRGCGPRQENYSEGIT